MANTGQIVKSKTANRFVTLTNDVAQSKDLSLKSKGLLVHLLSLPSDWVIYRGNLYKSIGDKKGSIDSAFKELQERGFILSVKVIDEKGRFVGWNHVVYDIPAEMGEIRDGKNPKSDFTEIGKNAPIQKKECITNTDIEQKHINTYLVQKSFKVPELNAVIDYFTEKEHMGEAEKFFNYYESNGWKVGKNPMKNWKAAANNWINNSSKYNQNGTAKKSNGEIIIERHNRMQEYFRKIDELEGRQSIL
jgi:hypothetical protein